jgi:hypothetical protein
MLIDEVTMMSNTHDLKHEGSMNTFHAAEISCS